MSMVPFIRKPHKPKGMTMLLRMKSLECLLLGCVAVLPAGAFAQAWKPTKPMTIVVPVAPGSSTDLMGRLLAERLPGLLGQPVVVRNNPGASGLIGAANVARSDPDGHTLLLSASTLLGAPHVLPPGASSNVDRKSTRLNSSHVKISYAVFCLKKK